MVGQVRYLKEFGEFCTSWVGRTTVNSAGLRGHPERCCNGLLEPVEEERRKNKKKTRERKRECDQFPSRNSRSNPACLDLLK